MKFIGSLIVAISLMVSSAPAFSADLGNARIGFLTGDVQINNQDTQDWVPAAVNTPLRDGDRIWVPEGGRAEAQVLGGVFIRLDAYTSFDILSLDGSPLRFYLNGGRAFVNNQREGAAAVQVDTPLASIGLADAARAAIDVSENGVTSLSVLEGYAFAETRNGRIRVDGGNTLQIGDDLTAEVFPTGGSDEWVAWNQDLDSRMAVSPAGSAYLPGELHDYAYDLDTNGRWYQTPEYGYVWTPTVSVSQNWAPYREGRWVWMGGNYVWISSERWGWAPYHYGRWAFVGSIGWCWVPPRRGSVYWAPGYVGWVHTPTSVSWVPLAPGDTYYAHGYYGPGSVNINKITINNIVLAQQYRNIRARNAVTMMHREAFLHGRARDFRVGENPFLQKNVGIGPPTFKPLAATRHPSVRKIPPSKLPPPSIRHLSTEKLRQEIRASQAGRGSVFKPQRQTREMPVTFHSGPRRSPVFPSPWMTGQPGTQGGKAVKEKEKARGMTPLPPATGIGGPRSGPGMSPIAPIAAPSVSPAPPAPSGGRTTGGGTKRSWDRSAPVSQPAALPVTKPPPGQPQLEKKQKRQQLPTVTMPGTEGVTRTQPAATRPAPGQPPAIGRPRTGGGAPVSTSPLPIAPQPVAPRPVAPQPVWRQPPVQSGQGGALYGQPPASQSPAVKRYKEMPRTDRQQGPQPSVNPPVIPKPRIPAAPAQQMQKQQPQGQQIHRYQPSTQTPPVPGGQSTGQPSSPPQQQAPVKTQDSRQIPVPAGTVLPNQYKGYGR